MTISVDAAEAVIVATPRPRFFVPEAGIGFPSLPRTNVAPVLSVKFKSVNDPDDFSVTATVNVTSPVNVDVAEDNDPVTAGVTDALFVA